MQVIHIAFSGSISKGGKINSTWWLLLSYLEYQHMIFYRYASLFPCVPNEFCVLSAHVVVSESPINGVAPSIFDSITHSRGSRGQKAEFHI